MSVRLFKNKWLELATVTPLKVFLPFWICALIPVVYSIYPISFLRDGMMVLVGLFLWTIIEYIFHRYCFHASSSASWVNKVVFIMHGNHHEVPDDPLRNLMPLVVTVPLAVALWYLFGIGGRDYGRPAFVGFLIGYICYDFVHYMCHQSAMRGRLGFLIKRHHMLHHHALEDCNFGVTSTFWDVVFRTDFRNLTKRSDAHRH
ncbi:MAG: sterol desaturase family protein [Acetobacter sp.]|uniref:sterol desaturase family protein n=1 Tax=Acetobacteraceae TaxID=433 RepID=UPI0012DAD2E3|nr:sterol desaturase family protein [Gluconobacter oxydans]